MNTLRTGLLLAAMTGLFLAVGYLLGRETGMVIAFGFAAATNLFAYWNADRMVLSMHGARQVDRAAAPEYCRAPRPARRAADAETLCDGQSAAQCLRHRT